jgi:hypothetical protein
MGLILSEPINKVVEILKILTEISVEDAKIHPKRPYSPDSTYPPDRRRCVSLAARYMQFGQAQKANSIRGSADIFFVM